MIYILFFFIGYLFSLSTQTSISYLSSWTKKQIVNLREKILIEDVRNGEKEKVKKYLQEGLNPNIQSNIGETGLFIASQRGDEDIVKEFLYHRANPNITTAEGLSPLFIASKKGYDSIVRVLLFYGADPNICNKNGETALLMAVKNRKTRVMEVLLKEGVNPNILDNGGNSALVWASKKGDTEMVKELLWYSACPNIQMMVIRSGEKKRVEPFFENKYAFHKMDSEKKDYLNLQLSKAREELLQGGTTEVYLSDTPLMVACSQGNTEMVKVLLQSGVSPDQQDIFKNTALFCAMRTRNFHLIEDLIQSGANVHLKNIWGQTIFDIAKEIEEEENLCFLKEENEDFQRVIRIIEEKIAKDQLTFLNLVENIKVYNEFVESQGENCIILEWLAKGVNINSRYKLCKRTALMQASFLSYIKFVQMLLFHGADPNKEDKNGTTALMIASINGNLEVLKTLIQYGAKLDMRNMQGETALMLATKRGYSYIVNKLLEEGADPNIKNKEGQTVLMIACSCREVNIVEWLLNSEKVDLNHQDNQGNTALMCVASHPNVNVFCESIQIIRMLMKKGANPNIKNNENETALMGAINGKSLKSVEVLLNFGSDYRIKSQSGDTALMRAQKGQDRNILEVILQKVNKDSLLEYVNQGNFQGVAELLERRVDLDVRYENEQTALMIATHNRQSDIVHFLLICHADVKMKDSKGQTALDIAKSKGFEEIEKMIQQRIYDDEFLSKVIYGDNGGVSDLLDKISHVNIQNKSGETALMMASKMNHLTIVQTLLSHKVEVNRQDNEGQTALMKSCDAKIIKALLEAGADPNIQDKDEETVLTIVARTKNQRLEEEEPQYARGGERALRQIDCVEIAKILRQAGANLDIQNNRGQTALIVALEWDNIEVAQVIMEGLYNPNICDKDNNTALIIASRNREVSIVESLLKKGANRCIQNRHGNTALIFAIIYNYTEIVKCLLDLSQADICKEMVNVCDEDGDSPLINAIVNEVDLEIMEILIKNGADVNESDRELRTALMIATKAGCIEMVKILLENKADPNKEDGERRTALWIASQKGFLKIVRLLLQYEASLMTTNWRGESIYEVIPEGKKEELGRIIDEHEFFQSIQNDSYFVVDKMLKGNYVDINTQGKKEQTALMMACQMGYSMTIKILLKNRPHLNMRDEQGQTALMLATRNGCPKIVEKLLKKGADPNIRDRHGQTALILASQNGNEKIVSILLNQGADPNIESEGQETALSLSAKRGYKNIVKSLLAYQANLPKLNQNHPKLFFIQWRSALKRAHQAREFLEDKKENHAKQKEVQRQMREDALKLERMQKKPRIFLEKLQELAQRKIPLKKYPHVTVHVSFSSKSGIQVPLEKEIGGGEDRVIASHCVLGHKREGYKIDIQIDPAIQDIVILSNLENHEIDRVVEFIIINEMAQAFEAIDQENPQRKGMSQEEKEEVEWKSQVVSILSMKEEYQKEKEFEGMIKAFSKVIDSGKVGLQYRGSQQSSSEDEKQALDNILEIVKKGENREKETFVLIQSMNKNEIPLQYSLKASRSVKILYSA